jgi:ketosteroid isomerase-like protein
MAVSEQAAIDESGGIPPRLFHPLAELLPMWIYTVRRTTWAMVTLLLSSHALGSQRLEAQRASPGDSAAVVEVVERYHAALSAGDTATVMSLLAPGAVVLESGGIESREEYRSHHLPADMAFAKAVPRERGPIQVRVNGGTAWAASTSISQGRFRDREIDSQGAELMVLRRTEEGWRIEAIHWSSRNRR